MKIIKTLSRAMSLFSIEEYETAKQAATDKIVARFSRGNVSIQNGWYMDEPKLIKLSASADVCMSKMSDKFKKSRHGHASKRRTA